ncbi:unnamed protein product [Dicrocoelium dendriticum]|nr:unnamed protein product [Dicrocoelium dendriticum]
MIATCCLNCLPAFSQVREQLELLSHCLTTCVLWISFYQGDAQQSAQMKRPLIIYVRRPKPLLTEAYMSSLSPNGKTNGDLPGRQEKDSLDSKLQCISDQACKTEEHALVNSLNGGCRSAFGAVAASSLPEQDDRPHFCEYCNKSFTRKIYLQLHIASVHLNPRTNVCNYCYKWFSRTELLRRHIRSVHLSECAMGCRV